MKHSIYSGSLTVALALVVSLMPIPSSAQEQSVSNEEAMVSSGEPSNRIDLEFGYFTCRRQTFREIYGSYFDYGFSFQHRINNRWSWSLRSEFIRLQQGDVSMKFWSVSEIPIVIYALSNPGSLVPVVGGGMGLTYRTVIAEFDRYTATQKELSAVLVAMTGVDLSLGETLVLGGRAYFDYHPFGDPSVGDLGDTGGYHFTFRLGFKL